MAIRAKWKGGDDPTALGYEYHSGIEARDLTDEDWDVLDKEQREVVRKSPLYEYVPERAAHASATAPKGGDS